jgi:hypothetical protein
VIVTSILFSYKVVEDQNEVANAAFCFMIILIQLLVVFRVNPYGYARSNLFQVVMTAAVGWLYLLAFVTIFVPNWVVKWVSLGVGWTALIGFAVLMIYKYPDTYIQLLYIPKNEDLEPMIRFQLTMRHDRVYASSLTERKKT